MNISMYVRLHILYDTLSYIPYIEKKYLYMCTNTCIHIHTYI